MRIIYKLILALAVIFVLSAHAETKPPASVRFKGAVVDADGRPADGAIVEWYASSRNYVFGEDLDPKQRVVASNGVFELQLPREGALVVARKPGLAPVWRQFRNLGSDVEERLSLNRPSVLAGIVVDEADNPVTNANVSVAISIMEVELEGGGRTAAYLSGKPARECFSARTSADGRFRIEGFPTNAAADLTVQTPGKALRQARRESLDMASLQGRAGEDIRLVVEPSGTLEGKIVTDVEGQAAPIARLTLQPDGPSFFMAAGPVPESRPDGTFRISDLAAGGYHLRALFGTNSVPDWVAETVAVSVEAAQTNAGIQITATRGGLLEVAVLDQKDRQPITRVSISAYKGGYRTSATSDSAGKALLRLPQGDYYQVSAAREGARALTVSTTVDAGKTNSVEMELPPALKIAGVVRRPDGQPAAGLGVQIVGGYSDYRSTLPKTDANGKFDLPFDPRQYGQPNRIFCLLIRDPEHNMAIAEDIDQDTGPLDLRLAPAMTIVGRAESAGKPLTNATAALVFWTGNSGMHLQGLAIGTNTPGHFEIPALPLGRRYGLSVSAPGYGQKYVNAIDSGTASNRIELDAIELKPANLQLAGKVIDADDKPVLGAYVNLSGDGQPSGNSRSDRDGRFRFEGVCEGSVRLYASARGLQGNISAQGGETNVVIKLGQNSAYSSATTTHKLKGVVTDLEGQPVSGAEVTVFPTPSNRVKTGTNGAFTLSWTSRSSSSSSQSTNGPYLVVRELVRNLAAAEHIAENTSTLDVQLKPALSVAGSVEGADGTPLADAQIGVWLYASRTYSEVNEELARTDARGNFEVKTLPIGPKYVVYATAVNYGRSQQDLGPSSLTDRVELPPLVLDLTDKLLAGQVVDARDKPVAGVNVSFSGKNQPATSSILTDSQGRFSFKVCEGAIRVFASGPNGYANVSAQGGDTNLVLQLARNQTSGRVATSGKSLRNFSAFGLSTDTAPGKPLLLCLFDAEQPPSRRSVLQLAGRYEALRQKGIAVVGIQATAIPTRTWHAWTNSNPLPFPLGRAAAKSTATRWTSDVDSLPWLILRNASGTVAAEGFAIEQLDAQLKRVQ